MRKIIASFALVLVLAANVTTAESGPPCLTDHDPDTGQNTNDPACVAVAKTAGATLGALTGCNSFGEKRTAAIENIAADRIRCAANMLGQPVDAILAKCGESLMPDDLKNLKDAIFGMKEGAAMLGAKIPDAPAPGTYLRTDAGAP